MRFCHNLRPFPATGCTIRMSLVSLALMLLAAFPAMAASETTVVPWDATAAFNPYAGDTASATPSVSTGNGLLLAAGTPYATPYFVQDSGKPGPTVVVVGGMHGNEPAGYMAARRFTHRRPARGRLIVVPEINKLGVQAGTRTGSHPGDPNRDYPRSTSDRPDTRLAADMWALLKRYRPDYLLDLHEGYDYHRINHESVGQSIIYYPTGDAQTTAKAMQAAVNRTIERSEHRFSILQYPIQGSLARAAGRNLGIKAMIVETSKRQTLNTRVAQHVLLVETLLKRLGM